MVISSLCVVGNSLRLQKFKGRSVFTERQKESSPRYTTTPTQEISSLK
jgi:hypothetical protein